ncbi:MAG: CHAT domain-containing protein, partial [Prochlorothrix sp.]
MTQEFHLLVTPLNPDQYPDQYLIRTEQVAQGVPLAEEQVYWPLGEWLAQAKQVLENPLVEALQSQNQLGLERSTTEDGAESALTDLPNLVALGKTLYDSLFQGSLRHSWSIAQGIAQHRGEVLRLRLGLKGDRLNQVPWEILHDGSRILATGKDIIFSRYQPLLSSLSTPWSFTGISPAPMPTPTSNVLRVLMVLSGPSDQANLALKQEALQLQEELIQGSKTSDTLPTVELTVLNQPGREKLTQTLEQGQYQVFHFAGHSNQSEAGGVLHLVNAKTGLTESLSGDDLAGLLANNGIWLAVLNSCMGTSSATSPLDQETGDRSLAAALIRHNIPAVLAMAERIPDRVALTLSRLFYRNIRLGYSIDLSLCRARQGLVSAYGSNQLFWSLPVLYLHADFGGHLVTAQVTPAIAANLPTGADPSLTGVLGAGLGSGLDAVPPPTAAWTDSPDDGLLQQVLQDTAGPETWGSSNPELGATDPNLPPAEPLSEPPFGPQHPIDPHPHPSPNPDQTATGVPQALSNWGGSSPSEVALPPELEALEATLRAEATQGLGQDSLPPFATDGPMEGYGALLDGIPDGVPLDGVLPNDLPPHGVNGAGPMPLDWNYGSHDQIPPDVPPDLLDDDLPPDLPVADNGNAAYGPRTPWGAAGHPAGHPTGHPAAHGAGFAIEEFAVPWPEGLDLPEDPAEALDVLFPEDDEELNALIQRLSNLEWEEDHGQNPEDHETLWPPVESSLELYPDLPLPIADPDRAAPLRPDGTDQSPAALAAIALYRKTIDLNPTDYRAHFYLGQVHLKHGHWEEAIAAYQQALTLNPNFPEAYSELGQALLRNDQTADAIVALRQAIALDPHLPQVYQLLQQAIHNDPVDAPHWVETAPATRPGSSLEGSPAGASLTLEARKGSPWATPSETPPVPATNRKPSPWSLPAPFGMWAGLLGVATAATVSVIFLAQLSPSSLVQTAVPTAEPSLGQEGNGEALDAPSLNPEAIQSPDTQTPTVTSQAILAFEQGDLSLAEDALMALLDRGALAEAEAVLASATRDQQTDPSLSFLQGRLAWQAIQQGNAKFAVEDARRWWYTTVQFGNPTAQHLNALAAAYYAEGNLAQAKAVWFKALSLAGRAQDLAKTEDPTAPGNLWDSEVDPKNRPFTALPEAEPDAESLQDEAPGDRLGQDNLDALTAYSGLALVLLKSAEAQPIDQQAQFLNQAAKLYNLVMAEAPLEFQADRLAHPDHWLWTEAMIADWETLGQRLGQ